VIRVLLVDDHTSVRQALSIVFERESDCSVVAQVGSLDEARDVLDGYDVAVVDLDLHNGDGVTLIRELHEANPIGTILTLTSSTDRKRYALAVEAGASGVLHKSMKLSEIIGAMRCLGSGGQVHTADELIELLRLASHQREQERGAQEALASLTPREREVLESLADGLNDKEIAERLHISADTTRTHMVHILGKLNVGSRLQALVFALRHGAVKIS
jgi:two-component system nitrate/nitrite response regulator NarL